MAKREQLRVLRTGTVINTNSKKQETEIDRALHLVEQAIIARYGVVLHHSRQWFLKDIVADLRRQFPGEEFHYFFETSCVRPDGGILSVVDKQGTTFTILISEVKHQGTDDVRLEEGLKKQAMGNAIERLGKNVIGLRTALLSETIFPFVCFGYGYDFDTGSSILDRVSTIAMFGELNRTYLMNSGDEGRISRGGFYFRREKWTEEEIAKVMLDISERALLYYFAKHGVDNFVTRLPLIVASESPAE